MAPERKEALSEILKKWLIKKEAFLSELQSLGGSLCFACKTVPQGKLFLRRIFGQMAYIERKMHHSSPLKLSEEFRKDIKWWVMFLPKWMGHVK